MKRLTLGLCLLTSPVYAADVQPQSQPPQAQQGMPQACQKNVIILSVMDSRFMSARDANQVAADLCQQIMAKAQPQKK